jgi:hypothetical protein
MSPAERNTVDDRDFRVKLTKALRTTAASGRSRRN